MGKLITTAAGSVQIVRNVEIDDVQALEATDGSVWVKVGAAFVAFDPSVHNETHSVDFDDVGREDDSVEEMTDAELAELMGDEPSASDPSSEGDEGDSDEGDPDEDDGVVPAKRRTRRTKAQIEADNEASIEADNEAARAAESESDSQ